MKSEWTAEFADNILDRACSGESWADLGREFIIDPSSLRQGMLKHCSCGEDAARNRLKSQGKNSVQWSERKNIATAVATQFDKPLTADQMVELFGVDEKVWECVRWETKLTDSEDKEGNPRRKFWGKATFKKLASQFDIIKAVDEFKKQAKQYAPKYKIIPRAKSKKDSVMLEVSIFDLHLGKLAWKPEVGEEYNIKIATEVFLDIINDVLTRTADYNIEKILFVVGNDFFHTDDQQGATSKGTLQDVAGRWQEIYSTGQRLLVKAIDQLRQRAPVDAIVVQGNHDWERTYYVGEALKLGFRNCKDVRIIADPTARKYYRYGKVLLGFTHGDSRDGPKISSLHNIMAQEQPEEWGKTLFREWHLGHIHVTRKIDYLTIDEQTGVCIRYLRSPSAGGSWSVKHGFIGGRRGADSFIWEKNTGLADIILSNIKGVK